MKQELKKVVECRLAEKILLRIEEERKRVVADIFESVEELVKPAPKK